MRGWEEKRSGVDGGNGVIETGSRRRGGNGDENWLGRGLLRAGFSSLKKGLISGKVLSHLMFMRQPNRGLMTGSFTGT